MWLLAGIIVYFVLFAFSGFWGRHLTRIIHKKNPSLYKEILGDMPSCFIEEYNYNSVRDGRVFCRTCKKLFTGNYPYIISPRKLFWFKVVNYIVNLGSIIFISIVLFMLYAAFSSSGHDLLMSLLWGRK